jgi:hypothetical protein
MPFFSVTCAFGGCHDSDTRQAGLYLGPNFRDGPADPAMRSEVLANLLAPATTTDLPRVAPGNPKGSFLILKIRGCQNRMGLTCGDAIPGAPCGDRMPALSAELPEEKKSLLARWIAGGAKGG